MKLAIALLLLIACTQIIEKQTPTTQAVCEKRATGEACGCGCLEPATCINEICLMTNLKDGEGCIEDKQCLSSDCQQGKCTRETTIFECEEECHRNSDIGCYTKCRDSTAYKESRR